jgi:hypothetical protein
MPIVLIIIGLAVAIGLGGYFLRPEETVAPVAETELPATPQSADNNMMPTDDGNTANVPAEDGDSAEASTNVPAEDGDAPVPTTPVSTKPTTPTPATPATTYADGTRTVNTSYIAPGNANHTMTVTLALKGDIVTASSIVYGGDTVDTSKNYQSKFMAAYQSQVIGKKLDSIKLSRVGGASLTSNAFNDAVAKVKAAATN